MEKVKKLSKKEAAQITKGKIQSTVVKMMKHKAFDKITIRDICKEAGVSIGTFYVYFVSKEAALLFSHLYVDDLFLDVDFSDCKNAIECVQKIVTLYLRAIADEDFEYIQQVYIAHIKCYAKDMFKDRLILPRLLIKKIDDGKQEGSITISANSAIAAQCLMRAARGHVYDYCINPNKRNSENWFYDAHKDMLKYIQNFLTTE